MLYASNTVDIPAGAFRKNKDLPKFVRFYPGAVVDGLTKTAAAHLIADGSIFESDTGLKALAKGTGEDVLVEMTDEEIAEDMRKAGLNQEDEASPTPEG